MPRSHKIWVQGKGGSARGFGVGNDDKIELKILVGSSGKTSKKMSLIRIEHYEKGDTRFFEIILDGKLYRKMSLDLKTNEFSETKDFTLK